MKVTVTHWTDDKVCTSEHGNFGFYMIYKTSHHFKEVVKITGCRSTFVPCPTD